MRVDYKKLANVTRRANNQEIHGRISVFREEDLKQPKISGRGLDYNFLYLGEPIKSIFKNS